MDDPLVTMRGVCKSFSGQRVLDRVDFDLLPGEVHVLAGENGAGKSTLIKILGGVHQADAGEVRVGGEPVRFRSVHQAGRAGVAIIHQELSLSPSMSVADNIFLGRESTGRFGLVRGRRQREAAAKALRRVGLDIDPRRTVGSLAIAVRQLVEIAKALSREARVIVMDEPTSALNKVDAERLFTLVAELTRRGRGVIYITHRMEEIERLADRTTVLRDGRRIVTANDLPRGELVRAMVGRTLEEQIVREETGAGGDALLRVRGLSVAGATGPVVRDVDLTLRSGRVLGLAGLQGSGASELLHALFGDRWWTGRVEVRGRPVRIRSPREAMDLGLALLTSDRATTGLCLGLTVRENVSMAVLGGLGVLRRPGAERSAALAQVLALNIRCRGLGQAVRTLSGGNQQKVALGKWLATSPAVLLLDDPTRGVDVGAKHEIYELVNQWTAAGLGVVMTSGELPELLGLADDLVVMHRGVVTARLARSEATPERVIEAAMGVREEAA